MLELQIYGKNLDCTDGLQVTITTTIDDEQMITTLRYNGTETIVPLNQVSKKDSSNGEYLKSITEHLEKVNMFLKHFSTTEQIQLDEFMACIIYQMTTALPDLTEYNIRPKISERDQPFP